MFLSKWVICRFHVNLRGCNIEPENDGLVQMMFFFQTGTLGFMLIFRGVTARHWICTSNL